MRCLASLAQLRTAARLHLVLVDNESTCEGSQALLSKLKALQGGGRFTSAALLATDNNLGFAAGMNLGLAYARSSHSPDFYWLLNNDIEVEPDALGALLAAAEAHPDWGAIGACINGELNHGATLYGGYRYQPWSSRIQPCYRLEDRPDYLAGAALFLREAMLQQVGLLDEGYFLYCEEIDLARRYQAAGWAHGCAPKAKLWHHSARSTSAASPLPGRSPGWAREYFENRSALRFTWRHHRRWWPVLLMVRGAAKLALAALGKRHFGAFVRAVLSFNRPLPQHSQSARIIHEWSLGDRESTQA